MYSFPKTQEVEIIDLDHFFVLTIPKVSCRGEQQTKINERKTRG